MKPSYKSKAMEQQENAVRTASRLKRAEVAASFGAGLIGGGIGVFAAPYAADLALYVLVAGVLMHGWGMYDKHAIERNAGRPEPGWMKVLYWLCWAVLVGLGTLLLVRVLL